MVEPQAVEKLLKSKPKSTNRSHGILLTVCYIWERHVGVAQLGQSKPGTLSKGT
jgi:hypothetical protein